MPSAILYLNEKTGYATTWDAYFILQMIMQPFLYEIPMTNQLSKPNASTMQMQMQKCINMPKIKYFCIFEINDMWKQQKTLQLLEPVAILRKHPSKALR